MKTPQTILITGATTGIGRHAALHLARAGHTVIATGRNEKLLAALEKDAAKAGLGLHTTRLDVTDDDSIASAVAEANRLTEGRGIDVLVNNAGYGQGGPVEEVSDVDLRRQFDTNVFGLVAVTRAFLPAMRARGKGRVVNVSSVGGRIAFPFLGVYTASKFALEALSDALRTELRPFGIEVALIEPGPIQSEFSDRTFDTVKRDADSASPYAAAYAKAVEVKRLSDAQAVGPECVSRAIEHASTARWPKARYVVPRRMLFVLFLAAWLPTRWMDAILRRMTGISGVTARPALLPGGPPPGPIATA
jgi:short-subunit dehydrogenase